MFNTVCFFSSSTSVRPRITDEQEAFIHQVLEILFDKQKCRDLITLDMLHIYCGGPEPMPAARRLNAYSRRCKSLLLCFFLPVVFFSSAYLTSISYPSQKWRQRGKSFKKGVGCGTQAEREGRGLLVSFQGHRQGNVQVKRRREG